MADDGPWNDYKVATPPAPAADDGPWNDFKASPAPQGQWGPVSEAANSLLLGAGPTLTGAGAYLRGDDYGVAKQAAQQAQAAYEAANPKMAIASSIAGGAIPAAAATMAGAPVALAGGVMGAMPGVFAQDPTQTVMGGALGAGGAAAAGLLGKAAMAAGRGLGLVAPAAATAPEIPAGAALKDLGGRQANQLRNMGATVDPAMIRSTLNDATANLQARGMYESSPNTTALMTKTAALAPTKAAPVFDEGGHMTPFSTPPAGVPLATLDNMRSEFGGIMPSASITPRDAAAAAQVKNALLNLYQNPKAISGADPAGVAALSSEARGNSHAGLMSDSLNNAAVNAENGAQATGSGMNLDNKYRQQATRLLNPETNRMAGFPPQVVAAVQAVNDGTPFQNILRQVANRFGGGGGVVSTGAALGAGAMGSAGTGSPWGALIGLAPPVIGHAAKAAENAMSARAMQAADEAARMTSPAYGQNAANFVPPVQGIGAQIGRALAPSIGAATANPGLGALFGN